MKSILKGLLLAMVLSPCCAASASEAAPAETKEPAPQDAANRMIEAAQGRLAPVYAPLAEHIAKTFDLADRSGIGIDLGSGPGTLVIELCKRTPMHWINADINPHFFAYFIQEAQKAGVGHRVSAMLADAHALPFRDDYADVIVSRGSFQFWQDKPQAFREIHRVLKPGGVAFIGRGFSPNLPVETARRIRDTQKQGKGFPKYDVEETAAELRTVMQRIGIADFRIQTPRPPGAEDVSYGIWIEFRKPQ